MSANRPQLAFSGDTSGPLATQLKSYAELVPLDVASGANAEGLLVDGQQDPPPDSSALEGVLNSGKLLALASPSESLVQLLRELTGQSPGPGVPLVTYRRSRGRAGYDCVVVPALTLTGGVASESGAAGPAQQSSPAAHIGPALLNALNATAGGAGLLGSTLSTALLVPPQSAMAGYSSFSSPLDWTQGYPIINNKYDDKTAQTNNQDCPSQFLTEFYVYWVNGTGTAQPYYVVILRQTGTMAIGDLVANNANSIGWFQSSFQLLPNAVADSNTGQPFTSGVTIDSYSPTTSSADSASVLLQESMWLYAKTQTGFGPQQFVAQVNDALAIQGWSILDQTSASGTAWEFYQSDTWNPVLNPPDDFNNWWKQVYNSNGSVKAMPDASYGTIQFEGYTVWKFTEPLFTPSGTYPFNPPPSLGVKFTGGWTQNVALLHNTDGCTGAEGSKHHHLFSAGGGWGWGWNIDLGQAAQLQNIGG